MKIAPVLERMKRLGDEFHPLLVHTGQHYDALMSDVFFEDLGLPSPDFHLGVGSGSHAARVARTLVAFEEVVVEERPDLVVVAGDVDPTLACALNATWEHLPVAHIEAGLRSRDRRMPEEITRILTDALSRFLFTPSPDADENLLSEGIECNHQVATAKAWVSDAYQRICALGHQCHGAIGFTKEHNMQLLSRRAKAAELFFGDTDYHLELVAKSMNL